MTAITFDHVLDVNKKRCIKTLGTFQYNMSAKRDTSVSRSQRICCYGIWNALGNSEGSQRKFINYPNVTRSDFIANSSVHKDELYFIKKQSLSDGNKQRTCQLGAPYGGEPGIYIKREKFELSLVIFFLVQPSSTRRIDIILRINYIGQLTVTALEE
ncbi:hypothetical protein BDF20DRAFT_983955 [Mycotypha africana]|uniref:uncharacterized protein n=1 Tax=Mycotypha africana TaxID=64632 RepID=UPI0023010F72|nr:uncharacterized protein BDF20DRAFT_983955 [Mycotypha africana]KAI8991262.1 hypothetical protein BDF20DRAFT_983955 [Mycotypha africana]